MKYAFLAIFILSSIIHLCASIRQNKKLRRVTKPFLLLALLGWYLLSVETPNAIIVAAILTSWLGDVLLIPKGVKWFSIGGMSFMLSHIFFIIAYAVNVDFSVIPVWAIILAAAAYIVITLLVFSRLKTHLPEKLFGPMMFYLLINGTMNCFALFQLITVPCLAAAVTFVGAMLFFASDSSLFFVRFKKDGLLKTHFVVMLTYILGEFLIVEGLILLAAM